MEEDKRYAILIFSKDHENYYSYNKMYAINNPASFVVLWKSLSEPHEYDESLLMLVEKTSYGIQKGVSYNDLAEHFSDNKTVLLEETLQLCYRYLSEKIESTSFRTKLEDESIFRHKCTYRYLFLNKKECYFYQEEV